MNCRVVIAAAVVLSLAAGPAAAQPQLQGAPRPTFSPYLNIVRPGGSPPLNYFGIVRPEIQARQAIGNLQGVVAANQQAIGNLQAGGTEVQATGHQTMFMNHGSYFLTGGAGSTGGTGGGPGATSFSGPTRTPPRR